MATHMTPFNPLEINLRRQTQHLAAVLSPETTYFVKLQAASNTQEFLGILSDVLANPAYTHITATLFRPILFDLCARWIDGASEDSLVALCYLVEVHEELFPILSRVLQVSFPAGPLSFPSGANDLPSFDVSHLHRLVLAYFRVLQINRQLPRQLQWSLTPLAKLIWKDGLDNATRLLAIKCYAIQAEMGEVESERLEQQILGRSGEADCLLEYGMGVDGSKKFVDGWLLETTEIQRVRRERSELVTEWIDFYGRDEGDPTAFMDGSDLSSLVENVEGVLLLKSSSLRGHSPDYIPIASSNISLTQLAHHISLRLPTLLTSTPSAGKALLLDHLANLLHPETKSQIVTLHLADTSLDARSLLGSYISSTTQSGSFEWKEGVLVRAMREGKWVVLEDVDRGSNEVLGTLKPLIESLGAGKWIGGRASIQVPGRGEVVAHEGFLLFATRSISLSPASKFPSPAFFGAHKFYEISLKPPPLEELNMVICGRFPTIAGSASKACIHLWASLNALRSTIPSKEFGLRDLIKFCRRVERLLPPSFRPMDVDANHITLSTVFSNPTVREDIYIEARDVFFGAGTMTPSSKAAMGIVANLVGEHLGLDSERCHWLTERKTPDFYVETDANGATTGMRVSRTYLPSRKSVTPFIATSRPFALHRPAVCLLSRIAAAISLQEPVLLIGETGTGKTSVVTHLAHVLRRPLVSLNLSNQTESSDLIGGLKPVDARIPGSLLQERFSELFGATFSRKKNEKFETSIRKAVNEGKWRRVVGLWKESVRLAQERFSAKKQEDQDVASPDADRESGVAAPRKRRKLHEGTLEEREQRWIDFLKGVEEFEIQHVQGKGKFTFAFVEGPLIKALRNGDWILLDEINLASAETLESISSLLHGPTASVTLTEHGELEPVPRHPDFRLFACMNPATDVGKKDLPPNIRTKFTEIDVPPPDADKETLLSIVEKYIGSHAVGDKGAIMNIADFYLAVKDLSEKRMLADGSNHRPHFSMRTLSRALTFAADIANTYTLRRGIWEGCLMAFTMVLDSESAELVTTLAHKHLLAGVRNPRSMLAREPNPPQNSEDFVKVGPFYLAKGPLTPELMEHYIMTPSVESKLKGLARIILTRRFPVLIEGPTSAGKTSSIEYLAKRTGHEYIRINNHEHTDIQEYIGSYVSDPVTGKLVFRDGLLVQALRKGSWIVLDELNLAPTDVLEALNRLLDDNRELVIPETHEVVRPHPHFMLFATQNPPGLYAGRKVLSRAFRNRFLEVHFEDVPQAELEVILCQRCRIAPSYGKKIVEVFRQLQKRRQSSRVFESKQGFVTLRDLFRWAGRDAVGYQELAENGYMLLAERTRKAEDKAAVKEVLENVMNVSIDEESLYDSSRYQADIMAFLGCVPPTSTNIIWTKAMRRLFILFSRALRFKEPVLLVGETGSGKTSVCQVFSDAVNRRLHGLSCHQNTETADIIGGLRPLRNRQALTAETVQEAASLLKELGMELHEYGPDDVQRLLEKAIKSPDTDIASLSALEAARSRVLRAQSIFEWRDGPLIEAMRRGEIFLLDEISLAEDSVLERLNSVLELERTIVLAERGGGGEESPHIQADDGFRLVATMNPGGDYGKKELSPALRNRFTEIWVPQIDDRHDLELIASSLWKSEELKSYTLPLLDFIEWLCARIGDRSVLTLRDILAWITFMNCMHASPRCLLGLSHIFHHAAHMAYLDGLSALPQLSSYSKEAINLIKEEASQRLESLVPLTPSHTDVNTAVFDGYVGLGPFSLKAGENEPKPHLFTLSAPTTQENALRLTRACQVSKPILMEGSPGVGKTSLVVALANITGQKLHRINLSDQTDLVDLFGSDLPVEGGRPGEFAWRDGEFLQALQLGHWVLLDEMNLAPQAVLEGLNAVLDHRGSVYIPELGRTFSCHPSFRIFAAQNPLNQGGGRKGLPKSFINRFTKVYIEELSADDYLLVCRHIFPDIEEEVLQAMIAFNTQMNQEVVVKKTFGRDGFPWEFNLRDVIRWGSLITDQKCHHPAAYIGTVYLQRFRTDKDRKLTLQIADVAFSQSPTHTFSPALTLTPSIVELGHASLHRLNFATSKRSGRLLQKHLTALETLADCVSQSWLAIVVGGRNSGKTELVRSMANLTGNDLHEVSINSATDTMDILGSFEQVDVRGQVAEILDESCFLVEAIFRTSRGSRVLATAENLLLELKSIYGERDTSQQLRRTGQLLLQLKADEDDASGGFSRLHARVSSLLASDAATGCFEWIDGPLVRALKQGHWILLDGANLCNPSVLDRLNSLCENNGCLVLSERGFVDGQVEVIIPHQDFRLFMTVDPHHGELSRAMRNRGTEITLADGNSSEDFATLQDYVRLPSFVEQATDIRSAIAQFDAVRRGDSLWSAGSCKMTTTSLGITQCSSRSPALLDQISTLSLAAPHSQDAYIPFVIRCSVPNILAFVLRQDRQNGDALRVAMPSLDPINRLLSTEEFQGSLQTLYKMGGARSTMATRGDKPIDLYLISNGPLDGREDQEISAHHIALLSYLDLISLRFMFGDDVGTTASIGHLPEKHAAIVAEIVQVIASVQDAIGVVSKGYQNEAYANIDDARKAYLLLTCTMRLQEVARDVPFDYSKAIAIVRWVSGLLRDASVVFSGVSRSMRRLQDMLSLSSGSGLVEIWEAFYVNVPEELVSDLQRLSRLAESIKDRSKSEAVRRQILQTMSITFIQPQGAVDRSRELRSRLDLYLSSAVDPKLAETSPPEYLLDPGCLAIELSILSNAKDKKTQENMQRFIQLACGDESMPIAHLVPFQRLAWSTQEGTSDVKGSVLASLNWLKATWEIGVNEMFPAGTGPGFLHKPIHLMGALQVCATDTAPLTQLASYTKRLDIQLQRLYLECDDQRGVSEMLETFFFDNLSLLSSCFSEPHPQDGIAAGPPGESLQACVARLLQTTSIHFRDVVTEYSQPLCSVDEPHTSGLGWVVLSRMVFALAVPSIPIDPAGIRNSDYHRLTREKERLESQLSLHQQFERLLTGADNNELLQHIRSQLHGVEEELCRTPRLQERDDIPRLHQFWGEVAQFVNMVLNSVKVDSLVDKLCSGDEKHRMEEVVLQESLSSFSQRLDTHYRDFSDLVLVVQLAIQYLRLGLRLRASLVPSSSADSPIVSAIVAYPSVKSATRILDGMRDVDALGSSAFRGIVLGLAAMSTQASLGMGLVARVSALDELYQQARGLWNIDRAKERDDVAASSTLYKQAKVDYSAMTDAEIEEHEFLALFPNFEDVLEDKEGVPRKKAEASLLAPGDQVSAFCELHLSLMSDKRDANAAEKAFRDLREQTIQTLLHSMSDSASRGLDRDSLAFRFTLLRNKIISIASDSTPAQGHNERPNFYLDPNVPEVRKAVPVLERILGQLEALQLEWPDQEVLRHLAELTRKVLDVDLHSPVAKILSAIEQLLLRTEDWEMYANRENTLRVHREALIAQIVEWRRLELASWHALLDSEAQQCQRNGSKWWFDLYDATIRGVLGAAAEEEAGQVSSISAYFTSLVPLLSDFMSSSTLGDFSYRLRLLGSFSTYSYLLSSTRQGLERDALDRAGALLSSTRMFFAQFSSKVSTRLFSDRAVLEKEIKNFIKLASWKDINVLALKQSAQRSHHQLYKVVRKFREVLRQPASAQLSPEFVSDPQQVPPSLLPGPTPYNSSVTPPENVVSTVAHLANLQKTFIKFGTLVNDRIRPMIYNLSSPRAEELATGIISTCHRLASISIPPSVTEKEKRVKFLKSVQSQKRKAWADLLKEMKHAGFAHRVKPELLAQNLDPVWVKEQPLVPSSGEQVVFEKLDGYFFKLQGCLPALRASASSHHDDVNSRDLTKGVAVVEGVFNAAVTLRASLASSLTTAANLQKAYQRISSLDCPSLVFYGDNLFPYLENSHAFFCQASRMVSELASANQTFHSSKGVEPDMAETVTGLEKWQRVIDKNRERLQQLLENVHSLHFPALQQEEHDFLQDCSSKAILLGRDLEAWAERHPQLHYLFLPSCEWVKETSEAITTPPSPFNSSSEGSNACLETLIGGLLVTIQTTSSLCDKHLEGEEDDDDRYLTRVTESIKRSNVTLAVDTIQSQLAVLLSSIHNHEAATECIPRILPFLEVYLRLSQDQMVVQARWVKSLFKLDYVLCSVVQTIATRGFCRPPEEASEGGEEGEETGTSEGMGLGEGSGKDNVSKEIEDESQVEGLKGDDAEDQPQDRNKDEREDALEMTEDFGGSLEDVPEDSDQEEQEESDDEDGSDADHEERMEDLDPTDPNAIDEKLWGDEENPPDEKDSGDHSKQDDANAQDGKSEMAAKEGKDKNDGKQKEGDRPETSEDTAEEGGEDEPEQQQGEPDMEDQDQHDPKATGAPMDENIPEGDVLDLPDEMDLGEEKGDEGQMDEPGDDDLSMEEEDMPEVGEDLGDEDGLNDESTEPMERDNMQEDEAGELGEQQPELTTEVNDDDGEENNEGEDEESAENEITGKADVSNGDDGVEADDQGAGGAEESATSGQAGASTRGGQRGAESEQKADNEQGPADKQDTQTELHNAEETKGTAAADGQQGENSTESKYKDIPNPLRSLGDALKEIQQRFDDILNQDSEAPLVKSGDVDEKDQQLEYLRPDDEDADMQALGPAEQHDVARLNELNMTAAEEEDKNSTDPPMDIDAKEEEVLAELAQFEPFSTGERKSSKSQDTNFEGAILQHAQKQPELLNSLPHEAGPKAETERDELDHAVEAELRNWRAADYTSDGAQRLWRLYESLTHDLAYSLCEQLRLILEPTLATRLKGDYRTGKRLNMKKVISYIASDYTKDKIWLRRTKPSQREYQVLIAIDDSRSMAESHSIHLAYETLALLGKALNRLESGDISVVKFGEAVEVVHGFNDGPLTDQAGTRVIDAFRFNQKATNVLSLLESSLSVLDSARERRSAGSSSAADLWQLEIIISDGMCQDHEKLRMMLRKAEEKRLMVVFIILDSLHTNPKGAEDVSKEDASKRSILHMDKAEFKNVDGRMELQLQKYLDSFPFEYYVVLRDVEALPDVLSSTLKQFFERISEQ